MKSGNAYTTLRDIPAIDASDEDCRIPANTEVVAVSFDHVVDGETGEVFRLPLLQARNPRWYFKLKAFGEKPLEDEEVTLKIMAMECVRAGEGLMLTELYDMAIDSCPRREFSVNSFSSALSEDHRIEMRKDGVKVEKLKHNLKYCTYHVHKGV